MKKEPSLLPQNQTFPSPATYHRTCKTLTLEPFKQGSCNGDLSGLLISGEPTNEGLLEAWSEIVFEYSTLIKTENYLFSLEKEIGMLQHHIVYIDYAVEFLRLKYDEEIANEVRGLGYEVPPFTDENYQKALKRIVSLAKTVVFEHGNLVDEYNRLQNTVEGKKQTEEDFVKTIVMLSQYQHYNIDQQRTTIFEFAQIFNNYLSEMQARKKQLEYASR